MILLPPTHKKKTYSLPSTTHYPSGFTLIEILLSLALLAILSTLTLAVSGGLFARVQLNLATATLTQTLRRAQFLAQGSISDTSWGVKTNQDSITLFSGDTFTARDHTLDEPTGISSAVSLEDEEIVFQKWSGTTTPRTLTLTTADNETISLTINSKGIVSY